jgi:hypothetical protein
MDLLGTGRLSRRRSKIGVLVVAGATLALAMPPVALADDTAALKAQLNALTQQLNALAAQNQAQSAQVKALSDQVQKLTAAAAATPPAPALTVLPPGQKPAPGDSVVAVTEQPGNVPGRSGYPPESAFGAPGYPYISAPTTPYFGAVGTNPVGSGNSTVRLSLSGQVNRDEVYGNDGKAAEIRSLDNNTSSTRFRFQGDSALSSETSFGGIIELEIRPNSSANTTLTADQGNSVTNFTGGIANVGATTGAPSNNSTGVPTVRWADAYVTNEQWGAIHIGFGGTAGYLTAENDISGTFYGGYVNVSDTDGGFSFRQSGSALIPSGAFAGGATVKCAIPVNTAAGLVTAKTCFDSPANAYGPEVGSVFFFMDGDVRNDRIRYDSPLFNGFQFSTSAIDGGAADIALRYGADWFGTTVVASVAETFATSFTHGACSAYCYSSGLPTVANASVGQAITTGGTAIQTGPSTNGSNQFDGSFSVLTPIGLSLTMAGGVQSPIYLDPLKESISPNLLHIKVGWQTPDPWFSFGKTSFAFSRTENQELQFAGDDALDYAFQINQAVDPGAANIYVAYHHQTLDREFASYHPIDLALVGAIVKF